MSAVHGAFVPPAQRLFVTFDAVLFDLDGTLCRRTQDTDELYRETFERVGVEQFGEPAALWGALEGPPDHDDRVGYIGAGFARLAAQHGRSDVDPLALASALTDLVDDSQVRLSPGASTALDSAAAAGPVGLVTNGTASRQRVKLDALGVTDRFDATVYAFDLPRRKPHAEPFERALSTLDVEPERALYVGNSPAYDIAGGQNAGLEVAWLDDGEGPGAYDPEYTLESLVELSVVLEDG